MAHGAGDRETGGGVTEGSGRAAALLLACVAATFAASHLLYHDVVERRAPPRFNDFTSYYVAGLAVRAGEPESLYPENPAGSLVGHAGQERRWSDLAARAGIEEPNYYLYPPLFAVLFAPLTLLSYPHAFAAWLLGGAACLGLALALLVRRAGVGIRTPRGALASSCLALMAALFYPVSRSLAIGQASLLLLALLVGALVLLERRLPRADAGAGLCLACGILLKLTPVLLVPWLALRGRWRALAWTLAWSGLLVLVSIGVVGWAPHETYLEHVVPRLGDGTAFYPNQSITGLLARAWGVDDRPADMLPPDHPASRLGRWLGLILVAATLLAAARPSVAEPEGLALVLIGGLIAAPVAWEHHYVLALIPAGLILGRAAAEEGGASGGGRARAAAWGAALGLAGALVSPYMLTALRPGTLHQVAASVTLAGGILLWILLARRASRGLAPGTALLVMLCVFTTTSFLARAVEYNRRHRFGDFTSYYVAGATLLEGEGRPLYYTDRPAEVLSKAERPTAWTETAARRGVTQANYFLYPPHFAAAMVPLAALPYDLARDAWAAAALACLVAAVAIWRRMHRGSLTPAETALAVVLPALSWPIMYTFGQGQTNLLVLVMLVVALAALRSGRDTAAGLLVGAAAAVRLTPAFLLLWLAWRRRWRALAAGLALLGACAAGGVAAAGWEPTARFVRGMMPMLSGGSPHWVNQSPLAFFHRLVDGADMLSWAAGEPSTAARALAAACGLLLAVGAVLCAGPRPRPGALDLEFSLMALTTLFLSPLTWTHHAAVCWLGHVALARRLAARGQEEGGRLSLGAALLFAASVVLVGLRVTPPAFLPWPLGPLAAAAPMAGILILWGWIAALLARSGAASRAAIPRTASA